MASERRILIGAMSGTSADGVDVALVEITGRGLAMTAQLLHHHARAYDAALRRSIFRVRSEGSARLDELAEMGRQITLAYAAAVDEALAAAAISAGQVAAIAAHGQTLFHAPPNTIQWFDPSLLAAETGIAVVSDFRRADCAAGGQGAPLVPFADYLLFRHPTKSRVLLNLGGIANLTFIPAGGSIDDLLAFDTGPANCVIDWLMRESGSDKGFDADGALSLKGKVHFPVAHVSTEQTYFFLKPPKSTDGPQMIGYFREALTLPGAEKLDLPDKLATACHAAALAFAKALDFLPSRPDEIIASGGGTRNPRLMRELSEASRLPIVIADETGVPSEAKEAIAFALLGAATLDNEPSNVPAATGARRRVVLGSITPVSGMNG